MKNQTDEIEPKAGEFWKHRDYGAVRIIRQISSAGFRCRIPKVAPLNEHDTLCEAILPRWELTAEVSDEEWQLAEQGVMLA